MNRIWSALAGFSIVACSATAAAAESPRELLVKAAFATRDRAAALAQIESARKSAEAVLAKSPGDREAQLQRAVAIGYRGKLRRNPADARAARRAFEALVASNPRDAEALLALGGWHLAGIIEIGQLMARTVLGARKASGMQAMNRAIAAGGNRALFPAYASLTLIQIDPDNIAGARKLAEAAVKGRTPTSADRVMQRHAAALLEPLRAGNGKAAAALAKRLSPFGRIVK